jgi:signal transduction histidine kinase
VKVVGAGTIGDFDLSQSWVIDGQGIARHAVVAAMLPAELDTRTTILHGCMPISSFRRVTRADGPRLLELDGEPAYAVLARLLPEALIGSPNELMLRIAVGQKQSDRFDRFREQDYVNKLVLSADPEQGTIRLFDAGFDEGSWVQFMYRDPQTVLASAADGAGRIAREIGTLSPVLTLYFDCAGRANMLSGLPREEAEVVQEAIAPTGPLLGCYTGVEIAPLLGRARPLDWTGVLTAIVQRQAGGEPEGRPAAGAPLAPRCEADYYRDFADELCRRILDAEEARRLAHIQADQAEQINQLLVRGKELLRECATTAEIVPRYLASIRDITVSDGVAFLHRDAAGRWQIGCRVGLDLPGNATLPPDAEMPAFGWANRGAASDDRSRGIADHAGWSSMLLSADRAASIGLAIFNGPSTVFRGRFSDRHRRLSEAALQGLQWLIDQKDMEETIIRSKDAAEKANKAKSEFLANLSHELRTPLNAILGFSDMLQVEAFGALGHPKYLDYVKSINAAGQHLRQMIDDILDLSCIETQRLTPLPSAIPLAEIFGECERLFADRAGRRGIGLSIHPPAPDMTVHADRRMLRQMLINLIGNATKFTAEGGAVGVSAGPAPAGMLDIAIRDTGPGMPEDQIRSALENIGGGRDPAIRHHAECGAGIGLPLTRKLAEANGGSLRIASRLGSGTTVILRLPSAAE